MKEGMDKKYRFHRAGGFKQTLIFRDSLGRVSLFGQYSSREVRIGQSVSEHVPTAAKKENGPPLSASFLSDGQSPVQISLSEQSLAFEHVSKGGEEVPALALQFPRCCSHFRKPVHGRARLALFHSEK